MVGLTDVTRSVNGLSRSSLVLLLIIVHNAHDMKLPVSALRQQASLPARGSTNADHPISRYDAIAAASIECL